MAIKHRQAFTLNSSKKKRKQKMTRKFIQEKKKDMFWSRQDLKKNKLKSTKIAENRANGRRQKAKADCSN